MIKISVNNLVEPISKNYLPLLKAPKVYLIGGLLIITTGLYHFLDPTLQPHMNTLGVTPSQVNWILLSRNFSMSISAIIIGWIIYRWKNINKLEIISIGHLIYFISYLLLGPSSLLPIEPNVWLSVMSVELIGIAFSVSDIPTFEIMLKIAM